MQLSFAIVFAVSTAVACVCASAGIYRGWREKEGARASIDAAWSAIPLVMLALLGLLIFRHG